VAMVRVHGPFADAVGRIRTDLPVDARTVLVTATLAPDDVDAITLLSEELGQRGRRIRFVHPDPATVEVLEGAGLGVLAAPEGPTRASS